ncbi:MAG TPA: YsnF/AvaK domain-containing protein [Ktedonobacteraceae bacterium]|nr:YsnF/AvaK domain-containing protein [Ktedonobacteraceae bacterium]
MTTNQYPLVVGVFQNQSDAKRAIDALHDAGFNKDQLGLAVREGGVVTTNLLEDFTRFGIPQDRAEYYQNEFKAGHPIVSVRGDGREQEASQILSNYGAYGDSMQGGSTATTTTTTDTTSGQYQQPVYDQQQNYNQQANYDQQSYNQQANYDQQQPYDQQQNYDQQGESQRMRLREEQLNVDKERVQTGEVHLRKEVVNEQKQINVPVQREEVVIERHPFQDGQATDTPIGQDEAIRVPVSEERVNVSKTPVETGEVTIGKRTVQDQQQYTDTVQREEPRLEQSGNPRVNTDDDLTNR